MDQVIRPVISLSEYCSPYSETTKGSLSKNRDDDQKYLPEAAEQIKSQFRDKSFSRRCVSLVSPEKKCVNHYAHLAKNIVSVVDPDFLDSIDEESWDNMADSLKFSGIDSLEKANSMGLRVCPPCPVFHTWAALHGTTIFNGSNNPQRFAGINYVQRILREGTALSKNDIPLIIVFSDMNLTMAQIDEMKTEFSSHENIICVSFETELQLKFIKDLEKYALSMSIEFMDSIRIVVSQNISKVIKFCVEKAKSDGKIKLASRLEKLGDNCLFYSDIDNQWLSNPPFVLACHGMFTQPRLSTTLPLIHIDDDVVKQLSDTDKRYLEKHRSFFSEIPYFDKIKRGTWSTDKAKKLFDYILSGEAECNYNYLSKRLAHISSYYDYLLNRDSAVSWDGENSCLFVAEHSKDIFLRKALKRPCIIDLHQKPNSKAPDDIYNPDPYYREAHSLVGMQLLRYHYHGHDYTWRTW